MLADTSGLLAAVDAGEPDHERTRAAIAADQGPLVITDFVLAELDFLVLKRLGAEAEMALLDQVLEGVFLREPMTHEDLTRAREIIEQYQEHRFGIADASLMALSERLSVREVLTLDQRHFGVFRDRSGKALTLVP